MCTKWSVINKAMSCIVLFCLLMLSISIMFKSQQAISSSENLLLVAFGMDDGKLRL